MKNNKTKVLITGVAGLLGSVFADWIIQNKQNVDVIGIDNLSGGYIENVNKDVKFYKLDLYRDDIEFIFKENKIDLIYHFAAYAAEGLSPFIRQFNYENNLISTVRLINMAIKYNSGRFVFTSSMAVYGFGDKLPPFEETLTPKPIDPYGVAKYSCEQDLRIAGEQHGLDWCVLRPHNVYGVKQNIWDKYRNVLGIWMYQKLNNIPITIFGDGTQKRSFSYIDDCLEAFWKAGVDDRASKQIINIGGIKEYSINEACDILCNIMDSNDKKYLKQRHEVKYAYPTYQKSIKLLDYKQITSLNDGLRKMWEWAKKQPMRERFEWGKFEIDKGIYSYWEVKND